MEKEYIFLIGREKGPITRLDELAISNTASDYLAEFNTDITTIEGIGRIQIKARKSEEENYVYFENAISDLGYKIERSETK